MVATFAQPVSFAPESPLHRPPMHYLRSCLGRFATGVAVVTFESQDGRRGITVNSFTSVSMEPPLILVSLQRTVRAHQSMAGSAFTVNILGAEQQALALQFAGKPSLEPEWTDGEFAPRLAGVLSWFECTSWADYDGGDHTLFLGEVQHFDYRSGDALGFVGGQFARIPQPHMGHEGLW